MKEERIAVGEATVLILRHVAGNLDIRSGEEQDLWARTSDDVQVDAAGSEISLSCTGDCALTLPAGLDLQIDAVHGHAQIQDVAGAITGDSVKGHLQLRRIGPVQFRSVHGNLDAASVAGDLVIDNVGGDLRADGIHGQLTARVGGDLSVRNLDGAIQAAAGGDARLDFASLDAAEHSVSAGGDIVCRLPAGADASVRLQCGGRVHVQGPVGLQPEAPGILQFVLGDGEAALSLTAGGDIHFRTQPASDDEFAGGDAGARQEFARQTEEAAQQIAGQLEGQLSALARQLEAKLHEAGAGDEIAARVQEKVQSALRRAETNIANALRHVERQAQRAEERAARLEARQQRRQPAWPEPPARPGPRPAPVSQEQRMKVLHMLEQGKITVEQAEQLLSALGGKGAQS